MSKNLSKIVIVGLLVYSMAFSSVANGQNESAASGEKEVITLVAASMFDSTHPFNKCYEKFGELVNEYQDEAVIDLQISESKALGAETDFFRFMSQGEGVDIAIVDMPLIFKSVDHRNKVLASEHFDPIAQEAIDRGKIRVIGFAGGASRSIISNYAMNEHAITVRPLFISESTYKKLSPAVQEAGEYGSRYELDMADAGLAYARSYGARRRERFHRSLRGYPVRRIVIRRDASSGASLSL